VEVFTAHGLPASLYTDRGSHYFFTPKSRSKKLGFKSKELAWSGVGA